MSAAAPSWGALPRQQLALGIAVFALVALVTAAPVLVVVFGAFAKNAWYETFFENAANRSAIGYSFLLALRAPVAAFIGFLIAWLLIRIRIPGGRFIEFAMWVSFFVPLLPVTLSWILLLNPRYGLLNEVLKSLPFVHGPVFNIYSVGGILDEGLVPDVLSEGAEHDHEHRRGCDQRDERKDCDADRKLLTR